jgi:hypothetical protein
MVDSPAAEEPEPVVEPPPDANLYLKYTYGVNGLTLGGGSDKRIKTYKR